MLIRRAEVDGAQVDVRITEGRITEIGTALTGRGDELDAAGGALLPGLHDHHLHLLSMAAAMESVSVGESGLDALRTASPGATGWIRAVGYHESVAGDLDRDRLDELVPDIPLRIQHRSGALWMINTAGLRRLGVPDHVDGRFWREDDWLRHQTRAVPDLAAVGARLAALGITGVTDATPDLADSSAVLLTAAVRSGAIPQRVQLLGADRAGHPRITVGPLKILPPDHDPPDFDALVSRISAAHAAGRAVAVHTVTREALVVLLAVLDEVGPLEGDRIEHAALVPSELLDRLAATAVRVVTQPGMCAERADTYRAEIALDERPDLYRHASLLAAGVPVALSSDAPFASEDPWQIIEAATRRPLGAAESVTPSAALAGFLADLDDPGGAARRVRPGAPADLCLLAAPLRDALAAPDRDMVRATICAGIPVYQR